MVAPDSRPQRARRQAEIPLIVLCRFPRPALTLPLITALFRLDEPLQKDRRSPSHNLKNVSGYVSRNGWHGGRATNQDAGQKQAATIVLTTSPLPKSCWIGIEKCQCHVMGA